MQFQFRMRERRDKRGKTTAADLAGTQRITHHLCGTFEQHLDIAHTGRNGFSGEVSLIDLAFRIQPNNKMPGQAVNRLIHYGIIIFHSLRKIVLFHIRSNDYFSFRKIFMRHAATISSFTFVSALMSRIPATSVTSRIVVRNSSPIEGKANRLQSLISPM